MRKTFAALAALGLAIPATPAFAESLVIEYSDLNLATASGQEMLERRIDKAVRQYCGLDTVATGTRIKSRAAKKCYTETKAAATKQFAAVVEQQRRGG